MSSFMIWHKIVIAKVGGAGGLGALVGSAVGLGLPITISNNVYSLGLVLDVDTTLTMAEGAVADKFVISVYDLPDKDTKLLKSSYSDGSLSVSISLGYFDNPAKLFGDNPVMRGRVTKVTRTVGDDGRIKVEISGQEETGYTLLRRRASVSLRGSGNLDAIVHQLLDGASSAVSGAITLANQSSLGTTARDYTLRAGSVLSALSQLTELAHKPLVVADGRVAIGDVVGAESAPVVFDPTENVVKLGDSQQEQAPSADRTAAEASPAGGSPAPAAAPAAGAAAAGEARSVSGGLTISVLGHPDLRVGQMVTVTGLDDNPAKPLRISQLKHIYSTKTGYVCETVLIDAARGVRAPTPSGAAGVVDEWNKSVVAARVNSPSVDVGEVTAYSAGRETAAGTSHRATMHYAQVPADGVTAPSIDSVVNPADDLVNKPLAAPFAFDKVGLMTPVYPGMRALLVHNRALTNDAIVTGWLWPTNPALSPPPNAPGDYWLALPTELGTDGKPQGKGANDLTDARGARVIQTRSLHILVGTSALPDVGSRPAVPDDDTITIEHSSGTKITIASDGALSITTSNKPISIGNGSVELKLDGSSVAVS